MTQHTKSFFTQSPITFLYYPSPSTPLLPHNHHPLPLVQVFKPNKVNGFDVQTEGEARVEAGKHKPKKLTAKARLVCDGYSTHRQTDRRTDLPSDMYSTSLHTDSVCLHMCMLLRSYLENLPMHYFRGIYIRLTYVNM